MTGSRRRALTLALGDIRIAHSIFALPFAVFAAFLAAPMSTDASSAAFPTGASWFTFLGQLAIIIACMVFARTWAMLINRLADRRFDAANPRTASRAIASGALSPHDGWLITLASAAAFLGCCLLFWILYSNPWPAILSLPTLLWIALYSFTKRFTALSHLFLGGALAASPIAAAIAVNPSSLGSTPALWLIAAMVLVWVAGFDVAYALQDLEFDKRIGLFSLPARVGPTRAIWISRALHLIAIIALAAAGLVEPRLGALFASGVVTVAALLIAEHIVLARRGLAGLPIAFFTINGVVSCLLGAIGSIDALR